MGNLALIIEDEVSLRAIYELVLGNAGFDVIEAADGEQALSILAETSPTVVLLDMLLPRVDGIHILNYIRTTPHLENTGIVIVTAHNHYSYTDLLFATDRFLLKPVRPHELLRAAQQVTATYAD